MINFTKKEAYLVPGKPSLAVQAMFNFNDIETRQTTPFPYFSPKRFDLELS
jgi:hypothetical protein